MRRFGDYLSDRRLLLTGRLVVAVAAVAMGTIACPLGAQAFEVSKWEAGTCKESTCTDAGSHSAFYTQAAGHPNFGITDFEFESTEKTLLVKKWKEPNGHVKDVRVDLPTGLAVNPEATTEVCSEAELNSDKEECPAASQVGVDEATGTAEVALGIKETVTEDFPVYNMERKPGQPSRFGVEINSPLLSDGSACRATCTWKAASAGKPEAATSENSGVDQRRLPRVLQDPRHPRTAGNHRVATDLLGRPRNTDRSADGFLTLPSTCTSPQITTLHVDSYEEPGHFIEKKNPTPVAATGCDTLAFNPSLSLTPETSQSDQPDGVSAQLHIPQLTDEPSKPNSPDVQSAEVTLPEGMTLNPSAANGLEACSNAQYAARGCPEALARSARSTSTRPESPTDRSPVRSTWAHRKPDRDPNRAASTGYSCSAKPRSTASACTSKAVSRPTRGPVA